MEIVLPFNWHTCEPLPNLVEGEQSTENGHPTENKYHRIFASFLHSSCKEGQTAGHSRKSNAERRWWSEELKFFCASGAGPPHTSRISGILRRCQILFHLDSSCQLQIFVGAVNRDLRLGIRKFRLFVGPSVGILVFEICASFRITPYSLHFLCLHCTSSHTDRLIAIAHVA